MKIIVSSTGDNLDSAVDSRFARCRYFIVFDTDSYEWKAIPNDSAFAGGGAGVQSAQLAAREGAKAIITGNIGPNASQTLSASGIKIFTGITGTVKDAIEKYKKGELKESSGTERGFGFRRRW